MDEKNKTWLQPVSTTPATKQDVVALQEDLEKALTNADARQVGICPVREEIYQSCFEEVIRQVTLDCTERGELLHEVKEDILEQVESLQQLYESAIGFGMRKALLTEERKETLKHQKETLQEEIAKNKAKVAKLQEEYANLEKEIEEKRNQANERHQEEVKELTQMNDQLKQNLEAMLAAPRR